MKMEKPKNKNFLSWLILLFMVLWIASPPPAQAAKLVNEEVVFEQNVTFEKSVLGIDKEYPGKKFYVCKASAAIYNEAFKALTPYPDGQRRLYVTVDEAINNCVASRGDVIYVLPGHTESYSAADGFDVDVAGVTIIMLGEGGLAPSFTFADTDATIAIGAANCKIVGGRYLAGISEVVKGISIEAGGDDLVLEDLFFPEPTTSTFEFDKAIVLASGSDRVTIQDCISYRADATGATDWLDVTAGVVNGLNVIGNYVHGEYANAPIYSDQINLEVLLKDNIVQNMTTGQFAIEFSAAATGSYGNNWVYTDGGTTAIDPGSMKAVAPNWIVTAIDKSPSMFPAQDDTATNFIGVDDNDNAAATTNVADNADGSILERLEHVQSDTDKIDGVTLATAPVANSLAAFIASGGTGLGTELADSKSIVDAIGTNGTTVADTATGVAGMIGVNDADNAFASNTVVSNQDGSVLERLEALAASGNLNYKHPNYLAVSTGTFDTTGTWSTAASHEIATVTGAVLMTILPEIKTTVVSASHTGTLALGDETTGASLIAATTMGDGLGAAGEWWVDTSLADTVVLGSQMEALTFAVGNGKDIGYTVATNAMTGGSITFHIWWTPLDSTGAVASGAGGTL